MTNKHYYDLSTAFLGISLHWDIKAKKSTQIKKKLQTDKSTVTKKQRMELQRLYNRRKVGPDGYDQGRTMRGSKTLEDAGRESIQEKQHVQSP